jgi:Uncharacterized membrane protein (homolog of Drosophila rhomboid)
MNTVIDMPIVVPAKKQQTLLQFFGGLFVLIIRKLLYTIFQISWVEAIIILCIIVFLSPNVVERTRVLAISREAVRQGRYYVFITASLSHENFQHIFLNMISFYGFGKYMQFQQSFLSNILLILTTCIGGTIASFFFTLASPLITYSHGLSGVIFGVIGCVMIDSLFVLYTFRYSRVEKSLLCDDCRAVYEINAIIDKTKGQRTQVVMCEECSPLISKNIYPEILVFAVNLIYFLISGWCIVSMFMEYGTKGIDFSCHCGGLGVGILFSVFKNLFILVLERDDN